MKLIFNFVKYLGLFLDNKLTWKNHTEHIQTKLSAASSAIYKLCKNIPHLMPVYCSLVHSHLQYAIICWEILPKPLNSNYKSNKIAS